MSPRLRIASLYRTLGVGGDENRLLSFARALDRARFEHLVVVAFAAEPEEAESEGPMLAAYRKAAVEVLQLDPRPLRGPSRARVAAQLARAAVRLARLLRRRAVDVLDARLAPAIPLAVAAGALAGTPVLVGTQYHGAQGGRPLARALSQVCWPLLDALVCDSQARLEELRAGLRYPPFGVVIANGIEPPSSALSPAEARRALHLPEDPAVRVVGQVSRLVRFKGHLVLLEAARTVLARRPDTFFLLCGFDREAGYHDELQRRARELGIAGRVRLTSYPGPVGDVWQAIDVHAHASLLDSSPIAILEGMSLGKPAVAARVGGIPELVAHQRSGLLVPPGHADALAAATLRLLEDPGLAARLGAEARRRYEERHRPETMARATEALFDELAARRRHPRHGLRESTSEQAGPSPGSAPRAVASGRAHAAPPTGPATERSPDFPGATETKREDHR